MGQYLVTWPLGIIPAFINYALSFFIVAVDIYPASQSCTFVTTVPLWWWVVYWWRSWLDQLLVHPFWLLGIILVAIQYVLSLLFIFAMSLPCHLWIGEFATRAAEMPMFTSAFGDCRIFLFYLSCIMVAHLRGSRGLKSYSQLVNFRSSLGLRWFWDFVTALLSPNIYWSWSLVRFAWDDKHDEHIFVFIRRINALMNISIHIPPSVSGRAPYVNLQTEFINTFNFVNHAQYVYFEADRLHGLLINFPAPSYPFFRAGLCFDLLVASPGAMCCREFFSLWFILTDPLVLYLWCVFFLGTLTKLDVFNISMVSPTVVNLLPASLSVQGGFVVPNYALSFVISLVDTGTGHSSAPLCVPTIFGALVFFYSCKFGLKNSGEFFVNFCQSPRGVLVLGALTELYIPNLFSVSSIVGILLLATFCVHCEFATRNYTLSSVTMVVDFGTGLFFASELRAPLSIPTISGAPTFSYPCFGWRDLGDFPMLSVSLSNSSTFGQGPCLFLEHLSRWLTGFIFEAFTTGQRQKIYSVFHASASFSHLEYTDNSGTSEFIAFSCFASGFGLAASHWPFFGEFRSPFLGPSHWLILLFLLRVR